MTSFIGSCSCKVHPLKTVAAQTGAGRRATFNPGSCLPSLRRHSEAGVVLGRVCLQLLLKGSPRAVQAAAGSHDQEFDSVRSVLRAGAEFLIVGP